MNKFEIGERVRLIERAYWKNPYGIIVKVHDMDVDIPIRGWYYTVLLDNGISVVVSEKGLYADNRRSYIDSIKKVIFNGNRTIIIWRNGTKTIVKCSDDEQFDKYAGFSAAIVKALFGSTSAAQKFLKSVEEDQDKGEDHE